VLNSDYYENFFEKIKNKALKENNTKEIGIYYFLFMIIS